MASQTVQMVVPFRSIVDAVAALDLKDKQRLLKKLEKMVREDEEDEAIENTPAVQAELEEARRQAATGDYVLIEDLAAQLLGERM